MEPDHTLETIASIKALVLTACAYGNSGDVADVPAAEVQAAQSTGMIDTDAAAVAFATLAAVQHSALAAPALTAQTMAEAATTTTAAENAGFVMLAIPVDIPA